MIIKFRKAPSGKSIRFIGDWSLIDVDSKGTVTQEFDRGADIDRDYIEGQFASQWQAVAFQAGAKLYFTEKTGLLRLNFTHVPNSGEVNVTPDLFNHLVGKYYHAS